VAKRRYYYCPNCHDTMLGWVSDLDGREHWVCVGHPPCGLGRRPNPQARPPLGRPNVGRPWGVLVEAEEPTSPRNTSRSQGPPRRAAPTIHRSAVWVHQRPHTGGVGGDDLVGFLAHHVERLARPAWARALVQRHCRSLA